MPMRIDASSGMLMPDQSHGGRGEVTLLCRRTKGGSGRRVLSASQRDCRAPAGWRISPHAANDGKALQLVQAESRDEIANHLRHFDGIDECGEIGEIIETGG